MNNSGDGIHICTPSLVLDWSAFESNVVTIREHLASKGMLWRPHVKSHASGALARYLVDSGAVGVTTATLAQSIDMVEAGLPSVLLAAPVIGNPWALLADLQHRTELIVAIDSEAHINDLEQHHGQHPVPVVVEIDLGLGRTGARSKAAALTLARRLNRSPVADFRGFMGYEGHSFRTWPLPAKCETAQEAMDLVSGVTAEARSEELPVDIVTGGGTGSLFLDINSPMTESQAGGGIFMDATYRHDFHVAGLSDALFIDCTVITTHSPSTAVIDAGFKTFGSSGRRPEPTNSSLTVVAVSAHVSVVESTGQVPPIGSRLRLVPGYSDTAMVAFSDVAVEKDGVITGRIGLHTREGRIHASLDDSGG